MSHHQHHNSFDGSQLFSTIIPVYNRANLVCKAIDSVLAQEFRSHEVIVVDDGSSDDTLAVLAQYGDSIRVLRQTNQGPGVARNMGIAHAQGKYVAFLDSDDFWPPWTLRTYALAIEENHQPAMLAGAIQYFDHSEGAPDLSKSTADFQSFPDYLCAGAAGFYMGAGQAVIRADLLRQCGGFASDRVNAEDHDLAVRLGTSGKFVAVVSPTMVVCRRHDASASASLHSTYRGMRKLIMCETQGEYPGGASRQGIRRAIISSHARPVALALTKHGHLTLAWDLYRRTLRWHLSQHRFRFVAALPMCLSWHALRMVITQPKVMPDE